MNDAQFDILIEKLDEIRLGVIDVEVAVDENSKTVTDHKSKDKSTQDKCQYMIILIRDAFFEELNTKTGWGRNEIKESFEEAVAEAVALCS